MDNTGIEAWKRLATTTREPVEALMLIEQAAKEGDFVLVPVIAILSQPKNKRNFDSISHLIEKYSEDLVERLIKKGDYEQLATLAGSLRSQKDKEGMLRGLLDKYPSRYGADNTSQLLAIRAQQDAMRPLIVQMSEQVNLNHAFKYIHTRSPEMPVHAISFKSKLKAMELPAENRYNADFRRFVLQHPIKAFCGEFVQETAEK